MKKDIVFLGFILSLSFSLLLLGCENEITKGSESSDDFMLGGIEVNESDQDKWASTLKHIGMNTVSITVYARQVYWHSDTLYKDSIEEARAIHQIKAAKSNGLNVVFIPRIMLENHLTDNRFLWHGLIYPKNDVLLLSWFEEYTKFVTHWAKICDELDVDLFALGSEMRTLTQTKYIDELPNLEEYYLNPDKQEEYFEKVMSYEDQIKKEYIYIKGEDFRYKKLKSYLDDEVKALEKWAKVVTFDSEENAIEKINKRRALTLKEWHKLIEKTRAVYDGELTYAANFDNYQNVEFWDKLDVIGINAYFKLQHDFKDRTEEKEFALFKDSWEDVFKEIVSFQEEDSLNHPVLFTELGYTDKEKCSLAPWQGHRFSIVYSDLKSQIFVWEDQPIDTVERILAIRALRETNDKYNLLKGLLFWKLTTYAGHKEIEPFLVVIDSAATDPMQQELMKFAD